MVCLSHSSAAPTARTCPAAPTRVRLSPPGSLGGPTHRLCADGQPRWSNPSPMRGWATTLSHVAGGLALRHCAPGLPLVRCNARSGYQKSSDARYFDLHSLCMHDMFCAFTAHRPRSPPPHLLVPVGLAPPPCILAVLGPAPLAGVASPHCGTGFALRLLAVCLG